MAVQEKIIVVLNENDVVELNSYGDNDFLASTISQLLESKHLVILTDVNGIYAKDGSLLRQISFSEQLELADFQSRSGNRGFGGMNIKIQASQEAAKAGILVSIGNGMLR